MKHNAGKNVTESSYSERLSSRCTQIIARCVFHQSVCCRCQGEAEKGRRCNSRRSTLFFKVCLLGLSTTQIKQSPKSTWEMTFTEEQARWITGTLAIMHFPDRELPTDSEEPRDGERNTKGPWLVQLWENSTGKELPQCSRRKRAQLPPQKRKNYCRDNVLLFEGKMDLHVK